MNLSRIASSIDNSTIELSRTADLINIVLTEVFDECQGSAGDFCGKLAPYEHSFENVLISAIYILNEQQKTLENIAEQLYKLSKDDKQPE